MTQLAVFGGAPAVPREIRKVEWPVVTDADKAAVMGVLDSGKLVSTSEGETAVPDLEQRWAQRVQVEHCIAVSNGTTAITAALAGLGVGAGDEVIVPALSFIASALGPLHHMATPVFADIDPVSFNIDPASVAARITPRTAAIVPVHLHGLPADMDKLCALAKQHGLSIVEDAAQAHGAVLQGRPVGGWGNAAAFSLQISKNLPTCGEGGLITTEDAELAKRIRQVSQFGEVIEPGKNRDYISYRLGWNSKISPIQAAFTGSQLDRFDEYEKHRQVNISAMLERLAPLPGIQVPVVPPDRTHAWHILRFRFDPAAFGLEGVAPEAFCAALRRLLRAEGVPMSRYQIMPLPQQKVFTDRIGFGRGYPWTATQTQADDGEYPNTAAVIAGSLTLQKRHLHPDSGPLLQKYADAFEKVWEHKDVVTSMVTS